MAKKKPLNRRQRLEAEDSEHKKDDDFWASRKEVIKAVEKKKIADRRRAEKWKEDLKKEREKLRKKGGR